MDASIARFSFTHALVVIGSGMTVPLNPVPLLVQEILVFRNRAS